MHLNITLSYFIKKKRNEKSLDRHLAWWIMGYGLTDILWLLRESRICNLGESRIATCGMILEVILKLKEKNFMSFE